MAGPIDLPDINVWLAFSIADHKHHERARLYWYEESGDQLAFCRVTALGGLRLVTFDSDFTRFDALDLLHLKDNATADPGLQA